MRGGVRVASVHQTRSHFGILLDVALPKERTSAGGCPGNRERPPARSRRAAEGASADEPLLSRDQGRSLQGARARRLPRERRRRGCDRTRRRASRATRGGRASHGPRSPIPGARARCMAQEGFMDALEGYFRGDAASQFRKAHVRSRLAGLASAARRVSKFASNSKIRMDCAS